MEVITSIVERELGGTATVVSRIEEGLRHDTYEVRSGDTAYTLQLSGADEEPGNALT